MKYFEKPELLRDTIEIIDEIEKVAKTKTRT